MTTGAPELKRSPLARLLSVEIIGEVILLAAVGAFFLYMALDSREWGLGAQIVPWIALGIGAPFWIWRVGQIVDVVFVDPRFHALRRWLQVIMATVFLGYCWWFIGAFFSIALWMLLLVSMPVVLAWALRIVSLFRSIAGGSGQIMDTGFLESEDSAAVVARRWVVLVLSTAGLLLGVWTLGFHVGIPLYTILYLIILGNVRWYWTVPPSAFFLAVIIFIYGQLLLAEWNIPHWIEWFGIDQWWEDRFDPDETLRLIINFVAGVVAMAVVAFLTEALNRRVRARGARDA